MTAFHAQGRENDTIWLNSKLEPYKFDNAFSEILGQTPLKTQECKVGVAEVTSLVWERKQYRRWGPKNDKEGVQEHYGEIEAPRAIRLITRPRERGWGCWLGEGKKVCLCILRRAARGLSSSQR